MSLPFIWDNEKDIYFQYKSLDKRASSKKYESLEIDNYFQLLDLYSLQFTNEFLQKHRIHINDYSNSSQIGPSLPLKKCIYFETNYNGDSYFIESGNWYQIANDFLQNIDSFIQPMINSSITYGYNYNHLSISTEARRLNKNHEFIYNTELTNHLGGNSILLDTNPVHIGKIQIEICDILYKKPSNEIELIHVKKDYGASALSHLFSQGVVSLVALLDDTFRNKANLKIADTNLQFPSDFPSRRNEYTVIYGIISKDKKNTKHLPLFSKINLYRSVKNISAYGFTAKLTFIDQI